MLASFDPWYGRSLSKVSLAMNTEHIPEKKTNDAIPVTKPTKDISTLHKWFEDVLWSQDENFRIKFEIKLDWAPWVTISNVWLVKAALRTRHLYM
jgi:hypothetical protein